MHEHLVEKIGLDFKCKSPCMPSFYSCRLFRPCWESRSAHAYCCLYPLYLHTSNQNREKAKRERVCSLSAEMRCYVSSTGAFMQSNIAYRATHMIRSDATTYACHIARCALVCPAIHAHARSPGHPPTDLGTSGQCAVKADCAPFGAGNLFEELGSRAGGREEGWQRGRRVG